MTSNKEPSIQDRIENAKPYVATKNGELTLHLCFTESELHSLLEAYAKEQREICADEADYIWVSYGTSEKHPEIDRDSIRNAPSPTEKQ